MSPELINEAEALWRQDKQIAKFGSRFDEHPFRQTSLVYEGMSRLTEQIPDRPIPTTKEELHEAELKRIFTSRTISLEHFLLGKPLTLEDTMAIHCIEQMDLDALRPWLVENRQATIDAIERLFARTEVNGFEDQLPLDVPSVRQQAEAFAGSQITLYHQHLGTLFEERTSAGSYLHRITSEPSHSPRSYFDSHRKRLGLSIAAICYEAENGTLQLRERELIRLFGHEGMGHALQLAITRDSDVPFFLKEGLGATIATEESLTQHYEQVIFEDVKQSPGTQRALGIADRFEDIYQEALDIRQVDQYEHALFHYMILVLADKSLGDPRDPSVIQERLQRIAEVALYPIKALGFVEGNRYNYDSQGNLSNMLVDELRYVSKAVRRAFDIFARYGIHYDNKEQRSHIDMTFLTGYYTPAGFVQKAELAASGRL